MVISAPTSQHRTCFLFSHTWLSRQGNKIFRFTIHHLLTKNRDQKSDKPNEAKTRTTRISSFSSIFSHFPNIFFFFISRFASTAKKRRKPSAHSARRARWARCYLISFLMSNSWVLKDSLFFPFFLLVPRFSPKSHHIFSIWLFPAFISLAVVHSVVVSTSPAFFVNPSRFSSSSFLSCRSCFRVSIIPLLLLLQVPDFRNRRNSSLAVLAWGRSWELGTFVNYYSCRFTITNQKCFNW